MPRLTHTCLLALLGVFVCVSVVPCEATAERTVRDSTHWSFRPIRRPEVPRNGDSQNAVNAIDSFVQWKLKKEGVEPAVLADRMTQIRRLSLDLLGLPPTPEEVDAFERDTRPAAYERLVERLLAAPQFGERWARPWLDLCHYADTDGYLTDQLRPVAWRYRQWLIRALNRNLPFDQFTLEQLAGDLLPGATQDQRIATGFLRQTLSNREGGADLEEFRVLQIVDRVSMVSTAWLGLTVGCARCHDHKYDPLTQEEFFRLYACLDNADEVNFDAPQPADRQAYLVARQQYERRRKQLVQPYRSGLEQLQRRWEEKMLYAWRHPGKDHVWDRQWELLGLVWGGGRGEGQLEGTETCKLSWQRRTQRQQEDLTDFFLRSGAVIDPEQFRREKLPLLRDELAKLRAEFPLALRAAGMQAAVNPRQTYIHNRGDFRDPGDDVQPGTPAVLPPMANDDEDARLTMARWLVAESHPLTARVMVNRLWQEFFGRGLVDTPEDFGMRGSSPSHPDLLDWLAVEFIESGWDVKRLMGLVVCSATYRQSSAPRPELAERDPDNRLVARQASLRVHGETVRDAALMASGLLSTRMGGPSVKPPQPKSVIEEAFGNNPWEVSKGEDRYRRAIYTFIMRTTPYALTATFDAPSPQEPCAMRERSNTPLQALTLLNDPAFFEMAQSMAQRVLKEIPAGDTERIVRAFRLCLSRPPRPQELDQLRSYLTSERIEWTGRETAASELLVIDAGELSATELAAWSGVCSVVLNLHEFITRD